MEQDVRVRPMTQEENAAYRGITVDESGSEMLGDDRASWGGAYGSVPRGSVRYIRIGTAAPRRSFLGGLIGAAALVALLVVLFFVALPAVVMVIAGFLVLGAVVSLVGRSRIWTWVMRRLYGR